MGNAQMKHIGQIHPGYEPEKEKVSAADCQSRPRPQISGRKNHARQQIEKNNRKTNGVVYFQNRATKQFVREYLTNCAVNLLETGIPSVFYINT